MSAIIITTDSSLCFSFLVAYSDFYYHLKPLPVTTYCIKSITWIGFCLIRFLIINLAHHTTKHIREKKLIIANRLMPCNFYGERTKANLSRNVSQPT